MASKRDTVKSNYQAEIKDLRSKRPDCLYMISGQEEYLIGCYLKELKKACLREDETEFSYHQFDGSDIDGDLILAAVNTIPFFSERSYIEIKNLDINKVKDTDALYRAMEDIPEYCTVAIVIGPEYKPDEKIKFVKLLRKKGHYLSFETQNQSALMQWICKRFAANGKSVEFQAAERLIFLSGALMNNLIPEIDKISSYTTADKVTVSDVEAVAHRIPEAVVFNMTDSIANKDYEKALNLLGELLKDKDNEPIAILALLGMQLRRIYAARLYLGRASDNRELMELLHTSNEYAVKKLNSFARKFTLEEVTEYLNMCAETDYRMKSSDSSSISSDNLLIELVLRMACQTGA